MNFFRLIFFVIVLSVIGKSSSILAASGEVSCKCVNQDIDKQVESADSSDKGTSISNGKHKDERGNDSHSTSHQSKAKNIHIGEK